MPWQIPTILGAILALVAIVVVVGVVGVTRFGMLKTCPECHNRWAKPFTSPLHDKELPKGFALYRCQKCVANLVSENGGPLRSSTPAEREYFQSSLPLDNKSENIAARTGTLARVRRNYADSCAELQRIGLLDPGQVPPMPQRQPRFDDPEPLGMTFFRTRVEGDFSAMTLPRTFFGRSEVRNASFRDSDLSESNMCWCDFIGVDFSDASLRASDIRASSFQRVNFGRCDLRDADLRRSSFKDCSFAECLVRGMKLTRNQSSQVILSPQQQAEVDWQTDDGDEPGGG